MRPSSLVIQGVGVVVVGGLVALATGSLLSTTQRTWAFANNLNTQGGGPKGVPWPALDANQSAGVQAWATAWQAQMNTANLRNGHVVDVLLSSYSTAASPVAYDTVGDSCTWTGTYLAAQAFRFAVTGDPAAAAEINTTLDTLDLLTRCSGKNGYIVRAALPTADPAYIAYYSTYSLGHYPCVAPMVGLTWLGESSRDSYTGFAFGMAAVLFALNPSSGPTLGGTATASHWQRQAARARLLRQGHPGTPSEPETQAELARLHLLVSPMVQRVQALVTLVAQTLLADSWFISGPHGAVTNPTPSFIAMWQRLALTANPTAFAGKFDYSNSFKAAVAAASFDVKGVFESEYFSNNLMVDSLFVVAALDDGTDADRTAALAKATANVGLGAGTPHQQPTFAALTACYLLQPSQKPSLLEANLLQGLVQSSLADLDGDVKWDRLVDQEFNPEYFPHHGQTDSEHALLAGDRPPTTFLWQETPVTLLGGVNGSLAFAAVDRLLPYWSSLFCGIKW
jgi:hypothetical protein